MLAVKKKTVGTTSCEDRKNNPFSIDSTLHAKANMPDMLCFRVALHNRWIFVRCLFVRGGFAAPQAVHRRMHLWRCDTTMSEFDWKHTKKWTNKVGTNCSGVVHTRGAYASRFLSSSTMDVTSFRKTWRWKPLELFTPKICCWWWMRGFQRRWICFSRSLATSEQIASSGCKTR